MVDLHSVAASSHPSHRERESERETTSQSRAGRSRRPRGRTDTTTVVLESQSQPTAGMISSPFSSSGPRCRVASSAPATRQSTSDRSVVSAAEQWHQDVDQLVTVAINTPHRDGRHQPSAQQSRFLSTAREASMAQVPQCCQVHAHKCSTARRWPATKRRASGRKSTTVEVGRTVAPPSSATTRGVETSRVATSREISTCMHQWVRAKSHMHLSPLAPWEFRGGA
jgi:hypothetical protein